MAEAACRFLTVNSISVSPTTHIAATAVYFELKQNDGAEWLTRKKTLGLATPTLDFLISAAPITWRTFLQNWKQTYTRLGVVPQPPNTTL